MGWRLFTITKEIICMTNQAPTQTPSQLFSTLLSLAKGDLGKELIGPAILFLGSVKQAPPVDTVQGQAAVVAAAGQLQFALLGSLASGAPEFVQAEQSAIAGSLAAELAALEAKIT